jgi:hypothetical protein
MRVLARGGRLGLLHYMVPPYSTATARLIGVWGITIGPGSTIRAWTVLEKVAAPALPLLELTGTPYAGPGRPLLDVLADDLVADDLAPVRPAVRQLEPAGLGGVTEPGVSPTRAPVQVLSSLPCGCGELVEQARTGRLASTPAQAIASGPIGAGASHDCGPAPAWAGPDSSASGSMGKSGHARRSPLVGLAGAR